MFTNIATIDHKGMVTTHKYGIFIVGYLFDGTDDWGTVIGINFWIRIPFVRHRLRGGYHFQKLYIISGKVRNAESD